MQQMVKILPIVNSLTTNPVKDSTISSNQISFTSLPTDRQFFVYNRKSNFKLLYIAATVTFYSILNFR